jgi:subtilisin family serine protease
MSWFERVADAWHAAGILAVFAAGNSGPLCNTIYSPATNGKVLAVGAVNPRNRVCSFSSRSGPANTANMVMAPGLNIVSAYINSKFAEMSGTSMACPLVAGIAGLVLSANPELGPDQLMDILRETADSSIITDDRCCVDGKCAYGMGIVVAPMALAAA